MSRKRAEISNPRHDLPLQNPSPAAERRGERSNWFPLPSSAAIAQFRRRRFLTFRSAFLCLITFAVAAAFILYSSRLANSRFNWFGEPVQPGNVSGEVYHSLEVYVYPEYDYGGPPIQSTISGKYASEAYFFKNIKESAFLTNDPEQAHLFFIPISCHRLHQKAEYGGWGVGSWTLMITVVILMVFMPLGMGPGPIKPPSWAMLSVIPVVLAAVLFCLIHGPAYKNQYEMIERTLGADHFSLTCHDIDVGATKKVRFLAKNAIRVVFCELWSILGYWAGNRNSKTRQKLVKRWGKDKELDIQNSTAYASGRMEKFYRSKFCICPVGSRVRSNRITMAIHYGCVPDNN
ncbi:exostosin family protein [Striga asiatica]|uniref:Exostosin family protein n=1 Tax=Striga asiatica TaxID=4170 RepID=A0A5A7REU8_STRAF|nr:exostosin family protein [Striga asiatica]